MKIKNHSSQQYGTLQKIYPIWERTDPLRQLLKKSTEWKWTEREEEDFIELKKLVTEIQCLAHFAKDRDKIVTTDASRSGLGTASWHGQNDDSIPPIEIAITILSNAEKLLSKCDNNRPIRRRQNNRKVRKTL